MVDQNEWDKFIEEAKKDPIFKRSRGYNIDSKNLEHGPLNKNRYTYQFERILKFFLFHKKINEMNVDEYMKVRKSNDGDILIRIENLNDKVPDDPTENHLETFNLSQIIQHMNYDHLSSFTVSESIEILDYLQDFLAKYQEIQDDKVLSSRNKTKELQQRCIHYYTTDAGYVGINAFMRGNIENSNAQSIIIHMLLAQAISTGLNEINHKPRSTPVVARGISVYDVDKHRLQKKTDGTVWIDKGFLSTGQSGPDPDVMFDAFGNLIQPNLSDHYPFIVDQVNATRVQFVPSSPKDSHQTLEDFARSLTGIKLFIYEERLYCSQDGELVKKENNNEIESYPITPNENQDMVKIGLALFNIRPQIFLIEGVMGWDISHLSAKKFEREFLMCPMQGMTTYTRPSKDGRYDLNFVLPVRVLNSLTLPDIAAPDREEREGLGGHNETMKYIEEVLLLEHLNYTIFKATLKELLTKTINNPTQPKNLFSLFNKMIEKSDIPDNVIKAIKASQKTIHVMPQDPELRKTTLIETAKTLFIEIHRAIAEKVEQVQEKTTTSTPLRKIVPILRSMNTLISKSLEDTGIDPDEIAALEQSAKTAEPSIRKAPKK